MCRQSLPPKKAAAAAASAAAEAQAAADAAAAEAVGVAFGVEDMGGNLGVSELDSRPESPSPKDEVPSAAPLFAAPLHTADQPLKKGCHHVMYITSE